ncbi:MAG: VWA domain-containing protein [bacterium]|nr:VWA domain-containing protein [bacterium]
MRLALFSCFLLLQIPGALRAEDRDLDAFGEVIDVRVLNLEVAVTDKDGHFVPDLRPEDFRLLIDGEEVAIDYFSEIRDRLARPAVQRDAAAVAEIEAIPSVTPGEVVGTSFLLFVDNFFGVARDRELVIEEVTQQVSGFGPEDRLAIVAFDGRELDLVADWSSSPDAIAGSLASVLDQPTFGLHRMGEANRFALQLRSLGSGLIGSSTDHLITERVRELSAQVDTVVRAATTALRTMASPPGRKVMLLMSGGWPADPATYVAGFNADIANRTAIYAPKQAFADLSSTANLLGYTIYPVDLPGRQAGAGVGASDRGERFAIFSPPSTTPAGPTSRGQALGSGGGATGSGAGGSAFGLSSGREHEIERGLIILARDTGGRPMINGMRQVAMDEVLSDAGSYYWLGYTPNWQRDDESHTVRVEILRPGLESRSRRSFRDLSRSAEVTMMVESNLLFSTRLADHSLEVEVGTPKRSGRRLQLPVSLKIPLDHVVMLPVARGFEARLELRVAVLDDDGDRSEIPVIPVILGGQQEPPPGAHAIYDTALKIRKKKQRLALALYDLAGEKIFSTAIELDPDSL